MTRDELRKKTEAFVRNVCGDQLWPSAIEITIDQIVAKFDFLCEDPK